MPRPTGPEPDILALCLAGATAFEIWDSWNFRSDFPKIAAPEDLSQSVRTILADSAARARARAQRLADQEPTEISGGSEITGGGKRRKKSEKKSKSKSNNNRSTDLCENPKCLTHVPSGGIPRPIPLPVFYMNEDVSFSFGPPLLPLSFARSSPGSLTKTFHVMYRQKPWLSMSVRTFPRPTLPIITAVAPAKAICPLPGP